MSVLLLPLKLPERALRALESLAGAPQHVEAIHHELVRVRELIVNVEERTRPVPEMLPAVERISRQAEPLSEMLPAIEGLENSMAARLDALRGVIETLESDEQRLCGDVEGLRGQIGELHETIRSLRGEVEQVTRRLPDPDRGPLEKAKDVLTGTPT